MDVGTFVLRLVQESPNLTPTANNALNCDYLAEKAPIQITVDSNQGTESSPRRFCWFQYMLLLNPQFGWLLLGYPKLHMSGWRHRKNALPAKLGHSVRSDDLAN